MAEILKDHFDSILSEKHLKFTVGFNLLWILFCNCFYMRNMDLLLSLGDSFWWKLFEDLKFSQISETNV